MTTAITQMKDGKTEGKDYIIFLCIKAIFQLFYYKYIADSSIAKGGKYFM